MIRSKADEYLMDCELSIIVPVYNCREYLERTVCALLTQSVQAYEVLLIDDGSNDGSSELCDSLAVRYSNVRSYHVANGGPGYARNIGIEHLKGQYIAFCDSDDIPSDNMYGLLLETLREQQVDLVLCDIYTERDGKAFGFPWGPSVRFAGKDVESELMASMLGNLSDNDSAQPIWGSSVRCVYRRDIIQDNGIRFPEDIRFAEDLVFNLRYISHIKSCYILNKVLYRYTYNLASLMNSHVKYNPTLFEQRIKLVEYVADIIAQLDSAEDLMKRFFTSQRCYFVESVGNAVRSTCDHGLLYAYREICDIIKHPTVRRAFKDYDAMALKKRVSYGLIKHKMSALLLCYYYIRLRR